MAVESIKRFATNMERKLGLNSVITISLSAMLGSGLFVLPALASDVLLSGGGNGAGLWIAYVLSAAVVLPGAISKAELATAMPTSGGTYIYIERTFGPIFGTIAGLGLWASFLLKSAFALIGFSAYIYAVQGTLGITFSETASNIMAIILLAFIVVINILGVGKIKKIQKPIIISSVLFLVILCLIAAFSNDMQWNRPIESAAFSGTGGMFSIEGITGIGTAAAFVFVSYAGVTKIAAVAEEIKEPGKNLPKGMIYTLAIATILYALMAYFLFALMEPAELGVGTSYPNKAPIHAFAVKLGGENLGLIAAFFAVITMSSMALAGVMAASRFPFAMGRDKLMPSAFEKVNPRFETPQYAIIVTGIIMSIAILFLPVADVAKLASGFKIMIFIAVNMCVIVLRRVENEHTWYRPEYRTKMEPGIQIWGIFASIILLVLMGTKAFIGAGVAIIAGIILYATYGRHNTTKNETPWISFSNKIRGKETELMRAVTVFHAADLDNTNRLNLKEFNAAMIAIGWLGDDHERIRGLFHASDTEEDEFIDIDEFLYLLENLPKEEE